MFFLPSPEKYDYIIAGAGCAGLSLAMHMIQSGEFTDKKILITDKDDKQKNDRTWSFWETEPGLFEPIVFRRWKKTWFHGRDFSRLLELSPYEYKMIRGIDFYNYCFSVIRRHPNFEIRHGEIKSITNENNQAALYFNNEKLTAEYIFNSILFEKPALREKEYYLLQHFKGWIIETANPVFNPDEATLMDFRVSQQHGTTFVYVKPFSSAKALVEYTLFSEQLLTPAEYEEGLKEYISNIIGTEQYIVTEEENGIIPMTNYKFPDVNGRVIHTGTAGGQTKASSGYTFRFIQKHSARIVENLVKRKNPFIAKPSGSRRFHFYDSTLLYILKDRQIPGDKIFTDLFRKNKPRQVLRFLDNESPLGDELKIISSLPILPFLKAALKQL
ncbi:MAG: lycopene cyclase family protein [Bacteroidota bacterium]